MALPPPPPPPGLVPLPPNVGSITASPLLGSLLNFFLFGTLAVQVYVYRVCFPKDRLAIKWLVYLVALSMLVCTCLNAADAYYWWGSGFGDIVKFGDARFSPGYTPLWGSVIALAVQLFFCYRISVFGSGAMWWSGVIALVSMLQAAGGMGGGIKALITHNAQHDEIRTKLVYMWLVGDAVADLMIAVTMTTLLMQASEPQTRDIVRGIIRLIIETNSFSASVAIVGLVLFAALPGTDYFVCPTMVLPGIYANTLLVLLNNRAAPDRSRKNVDYSPDSGAYVSDGTTTAAGTSSMGHHWKAAPGSMTLNSPISPNMKRGYTPDTIPIGAFVAAPNPNPDEGRSPSPRAGRGGGMLQPHVSEWDDASYNASYKDPGRWDDRDGTASMDLGDVESHPYGSAGTYTAWAR
ncbi:hypothetical protein C8R43DRAFT_1048687 [Mycena crocata]|nr:hypothetical protein C8R43DRAFT_1048687 [Mycena crocata]